MQLITFPYSSICWTGRTFYERYLEHRRSVEVNRWRLRRRSVTLDRSAYRPLRVGAATPSLDYLPPNTSPPANQSHSPAAIAQSSVQPPPPARPVRPPERQRGCRPPTDRYYSTYVLCTRTHRRTHAHTHARTHYYRYLSAADGYGDDKVAAAASDGVYLLYTRGGKPPSTNQPRPPVTTTILHRLPLPASAHHYAKYRHRRHRAPYTTETRRGWTTRAEPLWRYRPLWWARSIASSVAEGLYYYCLTDFVFAVL